MNNYNSSSNNTKAQASGGGIGFLGLLTLAFIILKLCGVIQWSWLWVLSPIWIPTALVFAILIIVGIVALIVKAVKK